MGTTPKTAMTYERTPVRSVVKRKAMQKYNNNFDKMSTPEVLRRLYKRHSVGVWETIVAVTYIWLIVKQFS